jgi:S-adenosyl methyltransferase
VFFTGLELVSPGLVSTAQWRPDEAALAPEPVDLYAGVGRKR